METHIQKINQSLSTHLNEKEFEIAKIIWHVNQLVAYPLTDYQIESWAKSIAELAPNVTPDEIKKIIDNFKIGRIEWDYHSGIQNIFKNLPNFQREVYLETPRKNQNG